MDHRLESARSWIAAGLRTNWFPLLAVVLSAAGQMGAQISPGPLAKAHREFSGPLQCGQCHTFGVGSPVPRCLYCHQEIGASLQRNSGYHTYLMRGGNEEKRCVACHAEHAGEDHSLIPASFPPKSFDHGRTGLTLEGAHAKLECRNCHNAANVSPSARVAVKIRDLSRTYLGLRPECSNCHADAHRGTLGAACSQCHSEDAWTPASAFDHSQTRFSLTGEHLSVECSACHKQTSGPATRSTAKAIAVTRNFSGLAFSDCDACHQDPHQNSFKFSCWQCHQTSGWMNVKAKTPFDHNGTGFSLKGAHGALGCAKCHTGSNFQAPLAHEQCKDCHSDPHEGQFDQRAQNDCASCHNETAFQPSTFDLWMHQRSAFPLEGKHAHVECNACHPGEKAEIDFHPKYGQCADCHADAHQGQLAAEPWRDNCDGCHSTDGFAPSTFSFREHQKLSFTLEGAHRAVACSDCHSRTSKTSVAVATKPAAMPPAFPTTGGSNWRFHPRSAQCRDCHEDPHSFRDGAMAAGGEAPDCASCHGVAGWNNVKAFDHGLTKFPLKGAHRAVSCLECHHVEGKLSASVRLAFHAAPMDCAQCHEDAHDGQFVEAAGSAGCGACHNSDRWKPAQFDHDSQTTFSLAGAHEQVPCRQCHTRVETRGGRPVLVYAGVSRRCVECHQ